MTDALVRFHFGEAPAHAGLGCTSDPNSGWLDWPAAFLSDDARVPDAVRSAIASALARVGLITFLVSKPFPSMRVSEVPQTLTGQLLHPKLRQGTTRDPATIEALFDDPLQAWWLGSAVALVSNPDQSPPRIDAAMWKALTGDTWLDVARRSAAIDGVVRAGVDGGMAGWWSRSAALRSAFAEALGNKTTFLE